MISESKSQEPIRRPWQGININLGQLLHAATRCYRKAPDSLSAVSCVPVVAGFAIASFCIHTAYRRMSANILYTFIVSTESPCVPACILCLDKFLQPHHWTWFIVLILGGGPNSRHLPKTRATTAGTQKNRISRHRQNSHHQQQITLCTAHSAHPLTSPNLNKTKRTVL